jgi:quercetin dioxygenase-like cupin family protein
MINRLTSGDETPMITISFPSEELEDSWIDGTETARWRTASGHAGNASGSSFLEIDSGFQLPPHTDSAEEVIVVLSGEAQVTVGDAQQTIPAGGIGVVPADVRHSVDSVGGETLRFVALYASPDVTTTYESPVQPDGEREREPF